ncbi:hypothetical protein GCM10027446_16700 [Angustibacter peucedani]
MDLDTAARSSRDDGPGRHRVLARLDDAAVRVAVRTGVSPRAVVGLLVVALAVAGVLGVRVLLARSRSAPVPMAPAGVQTPLVPVAAVPSASVTATATTASAAGARATAAAPLVVHVVGRVRHAGVVRLPPGSRVEDAVEAAGGAAPGADLAAVNLARLVVDGEQVVVPRPGEPAVAAAGPAAPAGGAAASSSAGGTPGGAAGEVVDLNTATTDQLDVLPGVGPVLAGRIVEWRTTHGRFSTVDELSEVSGIGDKAMERLRPLVRV